RQGSLAWAWYDLRERGRTRTVQEPARRAAAEERHRWHINSQAAGLQDVQQAFYGKEQRASAGSTGCAQTLPLGVSATPTAGGVGRGERRDDRPPWHCA